MHRLLIPACPRASYFPDFLTPSQSSEGLEAGLEAVLAAPRRRVLQELSRVEQAGSDQPSLLRLADTEERGLLVKALRAYHGAVIEPYQESMQDLIDRERVVRARALLEGGVEGLLRSFAPEMRWRPPVLEVVHHVSDRAVHLQGRGLLLIPSYFCWQNPVTFADAQLPQVLVYPLQHPRPHEPRSSEASPTLRALLGSTRAVMLAGCVAGATSSELVRATGMSPGSVSFHTRALRDAGLILSQRHAGSALHSLTPLGAALLRRNSALPARAHTARAAVQGSSDVLRRGIQ
ncbi:helix-turn-helix domain-containing protein [Streptomyces sp. NPDC005408]|uniref:ArsR/SmtB family transcription factor n=1 Tax=Streptomyces sp. NPDC005408 TaxID=3155341 RepID=UPI0033AB3688